MFRSTTIFFSAVLLATLQGSLTVAEDSRRYVCLLSDPPNQCSEYCVSALQPIIDHITNGQTDWNTCEVKLNETQEILDRIEDQLTVSQLHAENHLVSLQANLTKAVPQDLDGRLDRIEGNQTDFEGQLKAAQLKTDSQLASIKETLSQIDRKIQLQRYQQIGSRYFFIEHNVKVNWTTAGQMCIDMDGHLAAFRNDIEFNGIAGQLKNDNYWTGINDIDKKGQFMSWASGKRAPYLKWRKKEPRYDNDSQRCISVLGIENGMVVQSCTTLLKYFICQSDDKV
ncbi:accessory gland protein Acp29AB-like [Drosophila eugracilis]|uniref:accessory gland protein Acp29AB-like n=1 Tax=Drosophila eugracilis TaxID=29029 RepID=UPI001BDA432C|nr:accessory gland protein Acp29AB-like [Drosophila eugracilis]